MILWGGLTSVLSFSAAPLPDNVGIIKLKTRLYDEYRIEVPLIQWNGRKFIRVSAQGYTTRRDVDALVKALKHLL